MHGVLNVLKPPGMTSHDAVAFVRRELQIKRVGHTGTLDPAAAGVLPICVGQATRLVEYLQSGTKEYIAEMTFGFETDTCDAVGKTIAEGDVSSVNLETLRTTLDSFRGEIIQTPPLFSAIKKDGKKLYDLAREGFSDDEIEIPTRGVTISGLHATQFFADANKSQWRPRAILKIECSGGTYIRSLVRDIGRTLGCGATMTFLVRTRSGAFGIENAKTLEEIVSDWQSALLPMQGVLPLCVPATIIDDAAMSQFAQGRKAALKCEAERVAVWNAAQTQAALALRSESFYKPEKVFFLDTPDNA